MKIVIELSSQTLLVRLEIQTTVILYVPFSPGLMLALLARFLSAMTPASHSECARNRKTFDVNVDDYFVKHKMINTTRL